MVDKSGGSCKQDSVRIYLQGSRAGYERMKKAFESHILTEVEGFQIERIELDEKPSKDDAGSHD